MKAIEHWEPWRPASAPCCLCGQPSAGIFEEIEPPGACARRCGAPYHAICDGCWFALRRDEPLRLGTRRPRVKSRQVRRVSARGAMDGRDRRQAAG